MITAGQAHDCTAAVLLLKGQKAQAIWADKAYDSNELREPIKQMNAQADIPSQSNRIERCFNRLKHWRRLATRYDRRTIHLTGFVFLATSTLRLQ